MADKKLLFLGGKRIGYECFRYLLEMRAEYGFEVSGILTKPGNAPFGDAIRGLASENGIPLLEHPDQITGADILYSVQYHGILKAHHIAKAGQAAVNLHMAPLPEYRGCNQFTYAILEERDEFGTTIHLMDEGIDSGPVLFQKRFPIPPGCWVEDLHLLTYEASLKLFRQTLRHVLSGNYSPVDQSLLVPKYGTSLHFRKEIEALKQLDMSWEQEKIFRHIRATSMPGFEGPWFLMDGKKMYIAPAS